ncbi:MAG TPA: TraB/GumN family protein [Rectinemataceae bacterium]|nr:TraB/GumN family protein [Rectinemataceae bacterium]
MPQTTRRLTIAGRPILIVGTAHISRESIDEVRSLIRAEGPARVCVEIDAGRYRSMSEGSKWENLDIIKVLKEGRGFLLLANLALSGFQRRMGSEVGVKPGEEMLAAVSAADELGIPYAFCDRDVQTTLKRAWGRSNLWNRSKLLASLVDSAVSGEKLSAEDIEKLKEQNELEKMMGELADFLPSVKEVLIDERDRYLAARIFTEAKAASLTTGNTNASVDQASPDSGELKAPAPVLAVVGAGHLEGIVSWLERLERGEADESVAELETLPKPSQAGKILGWAIPAAIVAFILIGFFKSGTTASLDLLLRWVLLNGSLAAIGSALCLAHPLTILVSFFGAPIATLNPFVGVGMFAGVVEAFVRKPRVSDFENLAEDVTHLKGFYRNRVTRILLIFFLSSLGGMIGNFISLPFLASGALSGK